MAKQIKKTIRKQLKCNQVKLELNNCMVKTNQESVLLHLQQNYLFRELEPECLSKYIEIEDLVIEKLYSNRPVYTGFRPNFRLDVLYVIINGGPVITRSTPLDRIIAITYKDACFGMRNLDLSYGKVCRAFPSSVESYKTTEVIKIPLANLQNIYQDNQDFQKRYDFLFELREKFEYHLLNCSTYPPQAVAALFRALVYQERELGNQPQGDDVYKFDLSVELIARACQLNHRTVEQVLKGLQQQKLITIVKDDDHCQDLIKVLDAESLKEVYGSTRDKVAWWPLK